MAQTKTQLTTLVTSNLTASGSDTITGAELRAVLLAMIDRMYELPFSTKISSYTAALVDENTMIRMNIGSANTFTIPSNSTVAFELDTPITVRNIGSGITTLTPASGVTFIGSGTYTLSQYQSAVLVKVATDTWDVLINAASTTGGNTTPAAPTVFADDTANTLSFSHALGATQIEVSTNGGTYTDYATAYPGLEIAVGDVARAIGYYKARTKAATGRNVSPEANSPAFTVAGSSGPTMLANWKADTGVTIGTGILVTQWDDITTGTADLIARLANLERLTADADFGTTIISYGNAVHEALTTIPSLSTLTMFIVLKQNSQPNHILSTRSNHSGLGAWWTVSTNAIELGSPYEKITWVPPAGKHLLRIELTPSLARSYVNGVLQVTTTVTPTVTNALGKLLMGGYHNGTAYINAGGEFKTPEMRIYGALTSAEITSIESALTTLYL